MNLCLNSPKLLNLLNNWYPILPILSSVNGSQSVRWRKPLWLPRAPSKLYIITQRKRLPPDETAEVLRLYNNHKFYMRLIKEHCIKENEIQAEFGKLSPQMIEQDEIEHQQLMEYNRKENERVAQLRKERQEKEKDEIIKSILEFKEEEFARAKLQREVSLQKLRETEELVVTFISPEDFEKEIEKAINNPVDYNFAIDQEGRKYEGRLTQPHKVDINTLPVLQVKDEGLINVF